MDASSLILTGILVAAGGLALVSFVALRGMETPVSELAAGVRRAITAWVVCPRTAILTKVRLRPELRDDGPGFRVCACERFPGRLPECGEECVAEAALHAAGGGRT